MLAGTECDILAVEIRDGADLRYEALDVGAKSVTVRGSAPDADACGRADAFLKGQGFKTELQCEAPAAAGARAKFSLSGVRT